MPGVVAVLTHEDAPAALFSTGRHELDGDDPADTRVLDAVMRFRGQRVAAVVAETEAAAEAGCRALEVDYEVLPAVFDPEAAMAPGAPLLHADKGAGAGIHDAGRNVVAEFHSAIGDVEAGLRRRRRRARGDLPHAARPARPPGDALRHRLDGPGRAARRADQHAGAVPHAPGAGRVLGLPEDRVRVFCERVGGGFGGKQEMLVEDVVALAALAHGPARQARADARGAVHRHHHAPSDRACGCGSARGATAR